MILKQNTRNMRAYDYLVDVPLTISSDEYVSDPAIFSAIHFMIPRCSLSTDAIFKTLDFADNLLIVMPFSPDMIGLLFSVQKI